MNTRLLKLAEFADSPEITQMESILDTQEKIEESTKTIIDNLSQMTEFICNKLEPVETKDYSEELSELKSKIEEPQDITVTLNII